jgi:hypothetical protein
MILTDAQSRQFHRIFESFMLHLSLLAVEIGLEISLPKDDKEFTLKEIEDPLLRWSFGKGGHLEGLFTFVATNPDNLSDAELTIALSWANVVRDDYFVVRKGPDVLFIDDRDHVFAVCGVDSEIDEELPGLPMRVTTYLAPFRNTITYLGVMKTNAKVLDAKTEERLLGQVDKAAREGRIARTGAQLISANEESFGPVEDVPKTPQELARRFDEFGGEHVGRLSGRSWEEREDELARLREASYDHDRVIAYLDQGCVRGEPTHDLRDIIAAYRIEILKGFAEAHDVYGDLTKEELVDVNLDIFRSARPKSVDSMLRMGLNFILNLRDLYENGGELRFEKDAIRAVEDLPYPVFPDLTIFDLDTHYLEVLSDEMTEHVRGVDFDELIERGRRLEDALAFLEVAVDYRGIIACDEATEELSRRVDGLEATDVLDAVLLRFTKDFASIGCATFQGHEYFVDKSLYDQDGQLMETQVRALATMHKRHPAVWPTDAEVLHGRLVDAWRHIPEGRALATYLDAHVPNFGNDEDFADKALSLLIEHLQLTVKPEQFLNDTLELLSRNQKQDLELAPLVMDLYNALPSRYLNGRTPDYDWFRNVRPKKAKKKRPTKKRRR